MFAAPKTRSSAAVRRHDFARVKGCYNGTRNRTGPGMFAVIRSLIDLIAEIVGGVLHLVGTFVSSCFGLVTAAMILTALVAALVLHLL